MVANFGTTCAEFAGIAAGMELFGASRYVSVPVAAAAVGVLVLRGSYRRIQSVLLIISAVFFTYLAAGVLAHPDWTAAGRGLVVPTLPLDRQAVLISTAVIGTTLAPWGLAFIQSYAVDKRLRVEDLRYVRVDVRTGSMLTGIIGFFVVVACAATLHVNGVSIKEAADAAAALEPLAGHLASVLFGIGLVGAAVLGGVHPASVHRLFGGGVPRRRGCPRCEVASRHRCSTARTSWCWASPPVSFSSPACRWCRSWCCPRC